MSHVGRVVASLDGELSVPSFTRVDVGARYRLQLGDTPLVIRVQLANVTDRYGWDVISNRSFRYMPGRSLSVYVAADF